MNQEWYNKTVKDVEEELSVTVDYGLTMEQVNDRIQKYGFNELKEKDQETLLQIIDQLKDFW